MPDRPPDPAPLPGDPAAVEVRTDAEGVRPWTGLADEIRRLWSLAWPVALGGLGLVSMFTVDTIMVGQLGERPLAALAAGNLWAGGFGIVFRSVLHGLDPMVAQAFGARDRAKAGRALVQGLVLAVLVSVPTIGVYLVAGPGLTLLGQPEAVVPISASYVRALTWGIPGMMLFWAMRQFLQGLGIMRPATWALLVANLLNVALNVVLIYGVGPWEGLGVVGSGYATSASWTFMALGLLALTWRELRAWWPSEPAVPHPAALLGLLGLGVPVGLQIGLEVWAFQAATAMMGWLGETALAAHAVALNAASLAFMVPLGLSAAAATRVGNLLGAGHRWQASGWVAIAMGGAVMVGSGTVFLVAPGPLAALFTDDTAVVALAAGLLPLAAAFGFFDGLQVTAFGVLRGVGDVQVPTTFNIVAYWVVGLPLGWWLARHAGLGPWGIWLGLVVALAVVASLLVVRLRVTGRRGGVVVGRGG